MLNSRELFVSNSCLNICEQHESLACADCLVSLGDDGFWDSGLWNSREVEGCAEGACFGKPSSQAAMLHG